MIEIKNLFFTYSSHTPYILNDISISIPKGSYVTILGGNGSAKSTLLKLLLGLLKPNKGSIHMDTNNLGYVPQRLEGYNSQFPITVEEVLKCHMKALKLTNKKSIKDSLQNFSMESYSHSLIGNLSGGQQQKVILCRALIGNPELLLLDEPSTGIDTKSQTDIYNLIYNLHKKNNMTVISVEHNLDTALKYSSHILSLKNGKAELNDIEYFNKFCIHC